MCGGLGWGGDGVGGGVWGDEEATVRVYRVESWWNSVENTTEK